MFSIRLLVPVLLLLLSGIASAGCQNYMQLQIDSQKNVPSCLNIGIFDENQCVPHVSVKNNCGEDYQIMYNISEFNWLLTSDNQSHMLYAFGYGDQCYKIGQRILNDTDICNKKNWRDGLILQYWHVTLQNVMTKAVAQVDGHITYDDPLDFSHKTPYVIFVLCAIFLAAFLGLKYVYKVKISNNLILRGFILFIVLLIFSLFFIWFFS